MRQTSTTGIYDATIRYVNNCTTWKRIYLAWKAVFPFIYYQITFSKIFNRWIRALESDDNARLRAPVHFYPRYCSVCNLCLHLIQIDIFLFCYNSLIREADIFAMIVVLDWEILYSNFVPFLHTSTYFIHF